MKIDNMKEISEKEFFATMAKCDVHPWAITGYKSEWKTKSGRIVGVSITDGIDKDSYFINA
jgi:hypothetical protein